MGFDPPLLRPFSAKSARFTYKENQNRVRFQGCAGEVGMTWDRRLTPSDRPKVKSRLGFYGFEEPLR